MKLNPALLAIAAAGVAAFVLLRPKTTAAQAPQRGFLDRVQTLGEGVFDFAEQSIDYARWGNLSAVRDVQGRYVSTVPIPAATDDGARTHDIGFWDLIAPPSWGRNVTTFGEPY